VSKHIDATTVVRSLLRSRHSIHRWLHFLGRWRPLLHLFVSSTKIPLSSSMRIAIWRAPPNKRVNTDALQRRYAPLSRAGYGRRWADVDAPASKRGRKRGRWFKGNFLVSILKGDAATSVTFRSLVGKRRERCATGSGCASLRTAWRRGTTFGSFKNCSGTKTSRRP